MCKQVNAVGFKTVFTHKTFKSLKRKYELAVQTHQTEFKFKHREISVAWAKYLIEYLESRFKSE